ncbi:hypothetical protein T01_3338 [Trichinella spiralis]|uniref:Uncharacterized protein n=1 Tax=Trichinella spiralis TaxID=6334 RepID=A0A0V1AIG2_TRISP|nr:hypothetical protein T01_3338 [Trichinella spiralis]
MRNDGETDIDTEFSRSMFATDERLRLSSLIQMKPNESFNREVLVWNGKRTAVIAAASFTTEINVKTYADDNE